MVIHKYGLYLRSINNKDMVAMTFTSSLPGELLRQLDEKAKELKLPKNKLIERALRIYLDQLNRSNYLKSYQRMEEDADILQVAEERMEENLRQIEKK